MVYALSGHERVTFCLLVSFTSLPPPHSNLSFPPRKDDEEMMQGFPSGRFPVCARRVGGEGNPEPGKEMCCPSFAQLS